MQKPINEMTKEELKRALEIAYVTISQLQKKIQVWVEEAEEACRVMQCDWPRDKSFKAVVIDEIQKRDQEIERLRDAVRKAGNAPGEEA